MCDLYALDAAARIFGSLPKVLDEPDDLVARAEMALAATLAGLAFQLPKNAMVHACSFPLSSLHHLPHGAACAFTLDWALRFNAGGDGDTRARLQTMAERCGFADCDEMAVEISRLKKLGGLPSTLKEANIPTEAVPEIVDKSFNPLMNNNPRQVTRDDLFRMYEELG
jgi:alcohol dehydrogenase